MTTKDDFVVGSVWELTREFSDDTFLVIREPVWDDDYGEYAVDIFILDDRKDPRRIGHRMTFNAPGAYWHSSRKIT